MSGGGLEAVLSAHENETYDAFMSGWQCSCGWGREEYLTKRRSRDEYYAHVAAAVRAARTAASTPPA